MNRNHFGRQTESFEADLDLPFLAREESSSGNKAFRGIFIRAPVVEKIIPSVTGEQEDEAIRNDTVIAPAKQPEGPKVMEEWPVEIMASLPGRNQRLRENVDAFEPNREVGDVVAVRQRNVFGTSFHPELTQDARVHLWWLRQVQAAVK